MTASAPKGRKRGARILERLTTPTQPKFPRKAVAEACGVSVQTVGEWVRGDSRPDPDNMAVLEDLGVPMRSWAEDDPESDSPLRAADEDE